MRRSINRFFLLLLAFTLLLSAAMPAALAASDGKVTMTIKYVTGAKNKSISKDAKVRGYPGDVYRVNAKTIKNYTFLGFTHQDKNEFIFPNKDGTLLVHYAKTVKATVKYVDQNGDRIKSSTTISGYDGKAYTVEPPYIQGYTFNKVSDPKHGVFGTSNHTITISYTRQGSPQPQPVTSYARLLVQSVNQSNGAVLEMLASRDVAVGTVIDLSSYRHAIAGYTFTGVYVNGVPAGSSSVRVTGNTTVTYYYTSSNPWPVPVTQNAHLSIYAVNAANGDMIRVLRDQDMPAGSSIALNAPNISSYDYQYTTVNGSRSYDRTITINYDTNVCYYYNMVYIQPVRPSPSPAPQPIPVDPDPPRPGPYIPVDPDPPGPGPYVPVDPEPVGPIGPVGPVDPDPGPFVPVTPDN